MRVGKKPAAKLILIVVALFICFNYWNNIEKIVIGIGGAVTPVIAGFFMAYVLNILMCFYERHYFNKKVNNQIASKTRRPVCLFLAILTLALIVAGVVIIVVPELVACVRLLVNEIPPAVEKLFNSGFLAEILPEKSLSSLKHIDWQKHIGNVAKVLTSGIGNVTMVVASAVTSVFSVVVTVVLGFVFSVYFLLSKEKLQINIGRFTHAYFPKKVREKLNHIAKLTDESFHNYIVGQCAEAVILGVMCFVGMLIFRFPYAGMISVLIGITALVPIAGAYIGAAVGAVMIFTVSPIKALLFLVFIVVLQQIEGNVVYPKVVGKSVGLPAVYVLVAITVGGGIGGIGGMLIGVPLTAVIYRLVREDVVKKESLEKGAKKVENK